MPETKDHVAGLAIQIPEKMILDTIRAEMVKAMPDPEKWVRIIINKAVTEENHSSYGRQTKMEAAIADCIREEVKAIFAEWIKQHREEIRTALLAELTRSKARTLKAIAEKLAEGLATVYVKNISLDVTDSE